MTPGDALRRGDAMRAPDGPGPLARRVSIGCGLASLALTLGVAPVISHFGHGVGRAVVALIAGSVVVSGASGLATDWAARDDRGVRGSVVAGSLAHVVAVAAPLVLWWYERAIAPPSNEDAGIFGPDVILLFATYAAVVAGMLVLRSRRPA